MRPGHSKFFRRWSRRPRKTRARAVARGVSQLLAPHKFLTSRDVARLLRRGHASTRPACSQLRSPGCGHGGEGLRRSNSKCALGPPRFQPLPTKFDIHEWSIMEDFSNSVKSARIRAELLDAIHGAGAFRHFKHMLRLYKIEQRWYDFRAEALRQIAIEWCEKNNIAWR